MSFKSVPYYKPIVDNMIEEYKKNQFSYPQEKIRNIVSRAYYTIFLHCRNELNLQSDESLSVHQNVISALNNSYSKKLLIKSLHDRKKADYHNADFSFNLALALSLQRNMNTILSYSKKDLLKN